MAITDKNILLQIYGQEILYEHIIENAQKQQCFDEAFRKANKSFTIHLNHYGKTSPESQRNKDIT